MEYTLSDKIRFDASPEGEIMLKDLVGRYVYVPLGKAAKTVCLDHVASDDTDNVFYNRDESRGFDLNYIWQCLIYTDEESAHFRNFYEQARERHNGKRSG